MLERDSVSWISMITGCLKSGELDSIERSIEFFHEMLSLSKGGVWLDKITIASVLSACAKLGTIEQGTCVHNYFEGTEFGIVSLEKYRFDIEIMAPIFSREAWRRVWRMIQLMNDLVHRWGLDFFLSKCVEEISVTNNREREIRPPIKSWRLQNKPVNSIVQYKEWLYCASNSTVDGSDIKGRESEFPVVSNLVDVDGVRRKRLAVVDDDGVTDADQ
ncbi:hypothetical protein ACFE04_017447 [Oxalis oulophora]